MNWTLFLIIAVPAAYLLVAVGLIGRDLSGARRADVKRRLDDLLDASAQTPDVVKERRLSGLPWLRAALLGQGWIVAVERLRAKSGTRSPVSVFLLLSALLALGSALLAKPWIGPAALAVAPLAGALPFLWLRRAARRRMERFERQLPDALDLMARCLKAGHTFMGGVRAAAEEMEEPASGEFRIVVDEVNYGKSSREALYNLSTRIDSADLRFLIVAANIQGESGGNLGEILSNLADLIRARFTFRRKTRVLTAQGRCSAHILTILPFAVLLGFSYLNPESANTLLNDDLGRIVSAITGTMMLVGIIVIRRMVAIRI